MSNPDDTLQDDPGQPPDRFYAKALAKIAKKGGLR